MGSQSLAGSQKVGQGPMDVKTKQLLKIFKYWQICGGRTSFWPDGDCRGHGHVVPGIGGHGEGEQERTQRPLIRVDSRWEGVSHGPHRRVLGEMGRKWQGQRLQGLLGDPEGGLGLKLPESLSPALNLPLLMLLHPLHLHSQQVASSLPPTFP